MENQLKENVLHLTVQLLFEDKSNVSWSYTHDIDQ